MSWLTNPVANRSDDRSGNTRDLAGIGRSSLRTGEQGQYAMKKALLIGSVIASCVVGGPAGAATFIVTNGGTVTFTNSQTTNPGEKVVTFNGANPAGTSVTLNGAQIVQGSISGQYAQPFGSDGSKYLSVYGNTSATIRDTTGQGYGRISLYLGSIDTYNSLDILSTTGAVIASFMGGQFLGGNSGDQVSPNTNRLISFTQEEGELLFGGVTIRSSGNSAEVDNVRFASPSGVPEPASWAMMLVGFGLLGGSMRSKRKTSLGRVSLA